MLLLIDNYDSFVYNLYQYLGELGAEPQVHRNDEIDCQQIAEARPTHIVISPGPCTPLEAGVSNDLIRRFAGEIPILDSIWAMDSQPDTSTAGRWSALSGLCTG